MNDFEFRTETVSRAGTTIRNGYYDIFIYEFINKKRNTTLLHFMIKPLRKHTPNFDFTTHDDEEWITIPEVGLDSDLGIIYNPYDEETGTIRICTELWVDTYDLPLPTEDEIHFIEQNMKELLRYLKTDFRHITEGSKDYDRPVRLR